MTKNINKKSPAKSTLADIEIEEDIVVDKTPRNANLREKSIRATEWRPPNNLEAPPAPDGYKHRWLRASARGYEDNQNIISRLRQGYELVRADEYPDWDLPTQEDGKHAGVIGIGGLLLARVPLEVVESRNKYFQRQTTDQMESVDRDLFKEEHKSMPIHKERQSRVTFGGSRGKNESGN
jgi:hypothetical protein